MFHIGLVLRRTSLLPYQFLQSSPVLQAYWFVRLSEYSARIPFERFSTLKVATRMMIAMTNTSISDARDFAYLNRGLIVFAFTFAAAPSCRATAPVAIASPAPKRLPHSPLHFRRNHQWTN